MFRSRTPGPEMISRGSEYRNEFQRPKTPTAHDMRSKTPLPGHSYGYSNANHDFGGGHYQNVMNGRMGYGNNQRSWGQNPNLPTSPPPLRRGDTVNRNNVNNFSQWSSGPPPRQSTSFEDVTPSPSNITQVPKRFPMQSQPSSEALDNLGLEPGFLRRTTRYEAWSSPSRYKNRRQGLVSGLSEAQRRALRCLLVILYQMDQRIWTAVYVRVMR